MKQDNIFNKTRANTKLRAKNMQAVSFAVFYVALVMCPTNHCCPVNTVLLAGASMIRNTPVQLFLVKS